MRSNTRGQLTGGPVAPVVTIAVLVITVMVGGMVYDKITGPEMRHEICADKFGEEATWINDSDETFDCQAPNGTEIENVTVHLKSNHGNTTLGGTGWPAQ